MSGIVRGIKWIAAQCAVIAIVTLAMNLLESAGAALPSHSAPVATQPAPVTIVDRSGKGDRLTPRAVNIVLPRGCESSVVLLTKLSRSDLVWRCVT
jgi:hypothetical protein